MEIAEQIKQASKEVLLAVVEFCDDGYGIYEPEAFIELGLPEEVVAHVTEQHLSDLSSPKSTIFGNEGQIMEEVNGVHGLQLLQLLANTFGITSPFIGRGRSARFYQEELTKLFTNGNQVPLLAEEGLPASINNKTIYQWQSYTKLMGRKK